MNNTINESTTTDLDNKIWNDYFKSQLYNIRGDMIWCHPENSNGISFCPKRCFLHKLSKEEQAYEIVGTLQLALTKPHVHHAVNFIIWYDLGRIRKNPRLVEKMNTSHGWDSILFCMEHYKTQEQKTAQKIITKELKEKLCNGLKTYKAPLKEHIFYASAMSGFGTTNIMPVTSYYDFSILLQPTLSLKINSNDNGGQKGIVWLNTDGTILVHHTSNGKSSIYDMKTKNKIKELDFSTQNADQTAYNTVYNSEIFPIIRYARGDGIWMQKDIDSSITCISNKWFNVDTWLYDVILAEDKKTVLCHTPVDKSGSISMYVIDIDTQDTQELKFEATEDHEVTIHFKHSNSKNSSAFFLKKRNKKNKITEIYDITKSNSDKYTCVKIENESGKSIPNDTMSINNFEQGYYYQFIRQPNRAKWRDKIPRKKGIYTAWLTNL